MSKEDKIFKRKVYDKLLQWKRERNGATAILIQGARRIGKSTLAEEFARREYRSYILINFAAPKAGVVELFNDVSDLNYIFFRLQLAYKVDLYERESVIIFDEVQMCPKARQAIKQLVKDGRYDYIETGSLISVRKNSVNIVLPSEETKIDMFPMDYEEFRWAMDDEVTIPLVRKAFERGEPLGQATHRSLMRDFRLYMLVGGMPQAVAAYLQTNSMSSVDRVKRDIIAIYREDFNKIDESGKALAIFDAVPGQLTKNASRFQLSATLDVNISNSTYGIIRLMEESMTVNVAYHASDPNVGLALSRDNERFKMYLGDTGLFITLTFMDKDSTDDTIYQKLLLDKLNTNLGYVYENVIAQMLRASGKQLYYNTMPIDDGKKYYEVDFVIADGYKVTPIEVKSSGYRTHASLDAFCRKYSDRIANRFLIYTKDLRREAGVTYLPVYMTPFI
ncbi:MAG: ATP-binding protein [Muribaculaceae bacterium]